MFGVFQAQQRIIYKPRCLVFISFGPHLQSRPTSCDPSVVNESVSPYGLLLVFVIHHGHNVAFCAELQESYRQVMKMRPKDLWKRLMIKFRGEEGLDYGGVAR